MILDPQNLEFCRSLLFVPTLEQRFVDKAHERGAGAIILDLEDAVAPEHKLEAREKVTGVAGQLQAKGLTVLVRVNHASFDDMKAAVSPHVAALVLPKVDSAAEIHAAADVLAAREKELGLQAGYTRLLILVETPTAVCNALEIAAAHERVSGLILGSEDLALGLSVAPSPDSLRYSAERVVMAARAAGKVPLGVPGSLATIKEAGEFASVVALGRRIGMAGTVCIHPNQVAVVEQAYAPDEAAVTEAESILKAFERMEREGRGAVSHEGKMLDAPIIERARKLVVEAGHYRKRQGAAPAAAVAA
ncbi:MAG: CoA ester lyase [Polaromonas sp.]|nr:CoA ester lyase [Polaromonas sp.]